MEYESCSQTSSRQLGMNTLNRGTTFCKLFCNPLQFFTFLFLLRLYSSLFFSNRLQVVCHQHNPFKTQLPEPAAQSSAPAGSLEKEDKPLLLAGRHISYGSVASHQQSRPGRAAAGPGEGNGGRAISRCPCGAGAGERGAAARDAALTVSLLAVDHPHEQRRVAGELREAETRTRPSLSPQARPAPPPPARLPGPAGPSLPLPPRPRDSPGEPPGALTLMSGETCTGGIILAAAAAAGTERGSRKGRGAAVTGKPNADLPSASRVGASPSPTELGGRCARGVCAIRRG